MSGLAGLRVLVAGAGALGSVVALRLQAHGARVILADPAAPGDNASGVAAGMLAPAFEAALDPASVSHFELYMTARALWPELAAALGPGDAGLDRSGALWVGEEASLQAMQARLSDLGVRPERLTSGAAGSLSAGLRAPAGAVHVAEDWRLRPGPMLAALQDAFAAGGGRRGRGALLAVEDGIARLQDGETLAVDHVVLATGMPPVGLEDAPAELAVLQPIKGQIALARGAGPRTGPAVRGAGIYVVPGPDGALLGATMEAGRGDREVEPAALERLRSQAVPLFPELGQAQLRGAAGVRASAPDALPLAGPSSRPGVSLALGARRNGWLLAPLVAEIVRAGLAGDAPPPWAAMLDPLRPLSPAA